jgi:hypothetical protein
MMCAVGRQGATGRPARITLLLGLVLLVVAHLGGAVHGPAFEGPHTLVTAVGCPASSTVTGASPTDRREHHGGGHDDMLDHTVDRLRGPVGPAGGGGGHAVPFPYAPAADAVPAARSTDRPHSGPGHTNGRIRTTLLCVSRQ